MERLLDFLDTIKNGQSAEIPVYSHEIYDIVPNKSQIIEVPDFLIIEGINVFQNPQNNRLYMSDFLISLFTSMLTVTILRIGI